MKDPKKTPLAPEPSPVETPEPAPVDPYEPEPEPGA